MSRIAFSLPALLLLAGTHVMAADEVELKLRDDSTVAVSIDGQEFTVLRFSSDLPKPFFSPVRGPGNIVITRPLEKPKDHPHHKGIWLSIDEVNEVKFWAERGKILNKNVDLIVERGNPAQLRMVNDWLGKNDKPVVVETTKVSIYADRLITYDITFTAGDEKVTFGDTKEGLFGIRVVDSMREREGGRVVNADGLKSTKECWGKPSAWVDYVGEVEGQTLGVAIFDHPKNFRPSRYHVRDYGLFSVSPFGESAYTNGVQAANEKTLEPGENLRLRYGIYLHAGDTAAGHVAETYQRYLEADK